MKENDMFEEYINLSDRSYGMNVKPVEHLERKIRERFSRDRL